MRTEAAQRKLKKRVRKHKKAASEARWETDQAYVALGNLHSQMEQVDQQRVAAQEARVDDQAVLAGLWEQLEAAHAKASTATRQRDAANNHAAAARIDEIGTVPEVPRRTVVKGACVSSLHKLNFE